MIVLKFYPKPGSFLTLPFDELPLGRSASGHATAEGVRTACYPQRLTLEQTDRLRDPQPAAAREMIALCRNDEVWAGDQMTADLCGVVFVPLERRDVNGFMEWVPVEET